MKSLKNIYVVVNQQNEIQEMYSGASNWDSEASARKALVCDLQRYNYTRYQDESEDDVLKSGRMIIGKDNTYKRLINNEVVTFQKFSEILPYLLSNKILRIVKIDALKILDEEMK